MLDVDAFRFLCHWIEDRAERGDQPAARFEAAIESVQIELERNELRIEKGRKSSGQNFEGQTSGFATADFKQGFALAGIGFFIDEQARGAVALVNGLGPARGKTHGYSGESYLAI